MEAKELRIGNYVSCQHGVVCIETITSMELEVFEASHNIRTIVFRSKLQPIPLTEEILLKCGFCLNERLNNGVYQMYYFHSPIKCYVKKDAVYVEMQATHIARIKSLHQLQNLYFALTGQELTVQP